MNITNNEILQTHQYALDYRQIHLWTSHKTGISTGSGLKLYGAFKQTNKNID